jgi:hypothetical protein
MECPSYNQSDASVGSGTHIEHDRLHFIKIYLSVRKYAVVRLCA